MTSPDLHEWAPSERGYRRSEVTVVVGRGADAWARIARAVLLWKIKTSSGFNVNSVGPVTPGQRVMITAKKFV